ncbi:MAG: right-handed parallel beta-helix repeat-containing protein [Candidatus Saliniplasma sp.]
MDKDRRTVWTVVFAAVLVLSTITILPMESTGEVLVVDVDGSGDYLTIQDAVDDAEHGDSIQVLSGLYQEDVLIHKRLILEGEDGVVIQGDSYGIRIESENSLVGNLSVEGSEIGIEILGDNNTVYDTHISSSGRGVVFYKGQNNSLQNSKVDNCSNGVFVFDGVYNTVSDCNVENISGQGILVSGSVGTDIERNIVDTSGYHPLYLTRSIDVNISDNLFEGNDRGTYIYGSVGINLENNSLERGLGIESDSKDGWDTHEMHGNTIEDGALHYHVNETDIDLESQSGQAILVNCTNSNVRYNDFSNAESGLTLAFSSDNSFAANGFVNNYRGIDIFNSENNTFHHNNFVNNTFQIHSLDVSSKNNSWDDGLGCGNYWSDYGGLDDGSNERTSDDGVGDIEIPHPDEDHGVGYHRLDPNPLMEMVVKTDNEIQMDNESSGWNFISPGIGLGSIDLNVLFSPVDYEKVLYYSSEQRSWKSMVPGRSDHFNDEITIDRSMGFWVRIDDQSSLNLTGFVSPRTLIELEPGWNMVGVISNISGNELPEDVDRVGIYNGTREYLVEYKDPDEVVLESGKGYWIHNPGCESIIWNVH